MAQVLFCDGRPKPKCRTAGESFKLLNTLEIAEEIPAGILQAKGLYGNYFLAAFDLIPHDQLENGLARIPTIQEVLYSIVNMRQQLADVVFFQKVRFMHEPFEVKQCACRQHEGLRQFALRYDDDASKFILETDAADAPLEGVQVVYAWVA